MAFLHQVGADGHQHGSLPFAGMNFRCGCIHLDIWPAVAVSVHEQDAEAAFLSIDMSRNRDKTVIAAVAIQKNQDAKVLPLDVVGQIPNHLHESLRLERHRATKAGMFHTRRDAKRGQQCAVEYLREEAAPVVSDDAVRIQRHVMRVLLAGADRQNADIRRVIRPFKGCAVSVDHVGCSVRIRS